MSSTAHSESRAPGLRAAVWVRRLANDEVARVASSRDGDEGKQFGFFCECGDLACTQVVTMTVAEYRRSSPGSVVDHPVAGGVRVRSISQPPMPDAATLAAANEHILLHVRDSGDGRQEWEFVCECGGEDCHERVYLTTDAYIALHDHGKAVLADRHHVDQVERARRLRANAEAVQRQASHQVNRAIENQRVSSEFLESDEII